MVQCSVAAGNSKTKAEARGTEQEARGVVMYGQLAMTIDEECAVFDAERRDISNDSVL